MTSRRRIRGGVNRKKFMSMVIWVVFLDAWVGWSENEAPSPVSAAEFASDDRPSRIIFGSCPSQHYEDQPFWEVIMERHPAAFVWAGDAVYADDRVDDEDGKSLIDAASPEYLRQVLQQQKQHPGYRKLVDDPTIHIFGTLDDHDYGTNNGDATFQHGKANGAEFVRFLGMEENAMARRAVAGKGVYGVQIYDFGKTDKLLLTDQEAGLDPDAVPDDEWQSRSNDESDDNNSRTVAVFVLDVRTNKDPWPEKNFNTLDPHGDFLGEEQWQWFETAIGRSNAAVNVIVTGIQVHAPFFYDGNKVENWSGFPQAQHRLYQAILQDNVNAPILISGDIHLAQLLRKDCRRRRRHNIKRRPLFEVTTSGMTHAWGSTLDTCGRRRDNNWLCRFPPYNALFGPILHFAHWISPWTSLIKIDNNRPQYTLQKNVAELEFDWATRRVMVRILGDDGRLLLKQNWSMKGLTEIGEDTKSLLGKKSFDLAQQNLETALHTPISEDDFVCVNYRGNPDPLQFAFSIAAIVGFAMVLAGYPVLFVVGMIILWMRRRRRRRSMKSKGD